MDLNNFNKLKSVTHIGISCIKWSVPAALSLLAVLLVIGLAGYQIPFWPEDTEVTNEKPFSNFIGQNYCLTNELYAHAWNDFPDKEKILSVSLMPPPGANNRFVSYRISLQPGQIVQIQSAWRSLSLFKYSYYYLISVPDAELPEGVPIKMRANENGNPSKPYFEHIQSNNTFKRDAKQHAPLN